MQLNIILRMDILRQTREIQIHLRLPLYIVLVNTILEHIVHI